MFIQIKARLLVITINILIHNVTIFAPNTFKEYYLCFRGLWSLCKTKYLPHTQTYLNEGLLPHLLFYIFHLWHLNRCTNETNKKQTVVFCRRDEADERMGNLSFVVSPENASRSDGDGWMCGWTEQVLWMSLWFQWWRQLQCCCIKQ